MYVLDKTDPHTKHNLEVILIVSIVYPAFSNWILMYQVGVRAYFSEVGNYIDTIYIWVSITNTYLQGTRS